MSRPLLTQCRRFSRLAAPSLSSSRSAAAFTEAQWQRTAVELLRSDAREFGRPDDATQLLRVGSPFPATLLTSTSICRAFPPSFEMDRYSSADGASPLHSAAGLRAGVVDGVDAVSLLHVRQVVESGAIIGVCKPARVLSSRVVETIKRTLSKACQVQLRVGHGGTLDAFACGVLVIGIGHKTKLLSNYLLGCTKSYHVVARLGVETDTCDPSGVVTRVQGSSHVTRELIQDTLAGFRGDLLQRPHRFSAVKRQGQRASEYAKRSREAWLNPTAAGASLGGGEDELILEPRKVHMYSVELLEFAPPFVLMKMAVSSGFYVRSFVNDLADQLGTVAMCTELCRVQQGDVSLESPVVLPSLAQCKDARTVLRAAASVS